METLANTPDEDDGWVVRPPDAEGTNAPVLDGLAPQFESSSDANLHAALMVRHGRLVYEHYFPGEDRAGATQLGRVTYYACLRHDLRSITRQHERDRCWDDKPDIVADEIHLVLARRDSDQTIPRAPNDPTPTSPMSQV